MLIQGGTISSGRVSTVWRRWRVLDELHQLVLENHLARREREIAADLEFLGIGLADPEIAVSGLDVLGQHVHAAHEILGVRGDGLAHDLRIGQHEIRRCDRVGDLPHIEVGLLPCVRVEPLRVLDQMVGPLHGQEIGLLEKIVELVGRPFGIGEALVARVGRGDRVDLLARHAFDRIRPQVEIGLAEARLQLERALRVAQPVLQHVAERLHHVGDLGIVAVDPALLARLEIGRHRPAALLDHAGDVVSELLDIDGATLVWFRRGSHGNASVLAARCRCIGTIEC